MSEPAVARVLSVPFFGIRDCSESPTKYYRGYYSVGMRAWIYGEIGSEHKSKNKAVVLEMCYYPTIRAAFYDFAEENERAVVPGTESMI